MTLQDLNNKYGNRYSNLKIESIIGEEIKNGNIDFHFLMQSYFEFVKIQETYMKKELSETATLLHMKRLGISPNAFSDRELHMINKHSSMSCEDEKRESGYDYEESERKFKEIYNLK